MNTSTRHPRAARAAVAGTLAAVAVFMLLAASAIAARCQGGGGCHLDDDAHYYRVIARRLAQEGASGFDGQTLTNGYQPLWLLVLAAQELTVGGDARVTLYIELALASAGLWCFLSSYRTASPLFRVSFAVLYALLARRCAGNGMEISLLLFALGLFVRAAVRRLDGAENTLVLAGAAVLCAGARLDAAFFVVPALALVAGGARRAIPALGLFAACAAAYAGLNQWVFGMPVPVSGAIKSLGGLQLNERLVDQVMGQGQWHAGLAPALAFANSLLVRPVVLFVLLAAALPLASGFGASRRLGLGVLIGFGLFACKLACLSSWRVWSWYSYPEIVALAVLFLVADDRLATSARRFGRRAELAAVAVLLLGAAWQARGSAARTLQTLATRNFELVNRRAVAEFGTTFGGARVAMGDRAGSFAWHYGGPVTQLEGIVGDKAYYEALRRGDDVRPLLCARGVRYVLAYQTDLGAYDRVTVPVLRPQLTAHRVPGLTFSREDEIGRVFNLQEYDNRLDDEGDNCLYAWRLSGCQGLPRPD